MNTLKEQHDINEVGTVQLALESGSIQLTLMPNARSRSHPYRPIPALVLSSTDYDNALDIDGLEAMIDFRDKLDLAIRYAQDFGAGE